MAVMDWLFGRPLLTSEARGEKLGAAAGIPVFGLDALSSAAYGPEAALALLIPLGAAGVAYIVPITTSIVVLLLIVYFSYRQTIAAYPNGGGSYTVAGQNLGPFAGLLAAAALMIDYVLTAAVGISAGVGALVSAAPSLEPHTLGLCLVILLIITLVNLRGVREAGIAFMIPTYLFVGTLLMVLGEGIFKTVAAGGHPAPVAAPAPPHAVVATVGAWLLLKSFASGCTAMTGVEAVSNGVTAFREPVVRSARRSLAIIIGLLVILLAGIAYLARAYGIGATDPGAGYQSVLSQLTAAVVGRNAFYFLTIAAILLVLSLSANTAFADFPRLCRLLARDGYLPSPLAVQGRRLVFTVGIFTLAALCGALLVLFGGITDRLIPLYAVGAFLAFTLSQAGMVMHWRRTAGTGSRLGMFVNGLGAAATATTVLVVTFTKFADGAWITTLLIPGMIVLMYSIRRHYDQMAAQIANAGPLQLSGGAAPIVVMPMIAWNKIIREGLEFAMQMSGEVHVLHVDCGGENSDRLPENWTALVEEPARRAGFPVPQMTVLKSPFRFVINPIVDHVLELAKGNPDREIAVIIPELVQRHWYEYFLHNQRAAWLRAALLLKGNQRIAVVNVPWYLDS
ncbi:MAG TPA: APC family permease [Candidatus Acidoferrales bacterium]|nr:APC family permease [Candidatus Acidoferrales bacterium]